MFVVRTHSIFKLTVLREFNQSRFHPQLNEEDYVIPALKGEGSDDQYERAMIIEPRKRYYDAHIATLIFTSLYPSILMPHNLSYRTLLNREAIERSVKLINLEIDYLQTPNNGMAFIASWLLYIEHLLT
ncbi:hypothetical protein BDZ89DRAFT_1151098 [Hymenopellis radicata]|nr:hypothetical protein BDZ89DRAFT_1151098 [Hymenopellis radicata]